MNNTAPFHPILKGWFAQRVGQPTDIQSAAWPQIAAGEHILITAPTGSGKTLTAFLWALDQLISGKLAPGHTHILYISPLKALNNDIQRNLLGPLEELREAFENASEPFPNISVMTRSGDTPEADRRRMERHPPEILITTPESLNLMLSSNGGRSILRGISTVILDEIHGVIDTKRGTHLITAVDRLIPLCGEFQRIALSATIRPLEKVAQFIGGFKMAGDIHQPSYVPRPVSIIRSESTKQYAIRVASPEEATDGQTKESIWKPLVAEFVNIIGQNRSTLLFVNSRRLCEKITYKINTWEDQPIAYAHHGSLSREIRTEVEQKFKAGELKAIVATNSLEMGIDIGSLDEVVLIQSPPSISSAIQRVGRSGHHVSETSKGTLFPTHSQDSIEAAVLAQSILSQDIESVAPIECPLDVLAQIIISMTGMQTWDIDALFAHLRTSYPYRNLGRDSFDRVLNMLAGRYAATRIRELRPRVSVDRLDNTVCARKGALLDIYTSGGMIPNRGTFHLRHHQTNARIGELDEEFVWETSVGQIFTLGTQNWKIERITHNDVMVSPGNPKAMATPFWVGEEMNRNFHFSEKIARFLEEANDRLDDPDFMETLHRQHCMDEKAAEQLIDFLKRQKERTDCDLPHRHHLLVEWVSSGPGGVPGNQLVLHTRWGGRLNRPFALALDAAWEERFGFRVEVFAGNDCIVLQLPQQIDGDELLSLVTSHQVESLLRRRLEGSGFFGARFRECSGRSLLLPRGRFNQRVPLWMSRLRSQRLLDAVLKYDDFPILLEAWRTCLQDEFDMKSLRQILSEIESGAIRFSETHTPYPSPMAQSVTWNQVNQYMYMRDDPLAEKSSQLRADLLQEVVFTPGLRPDVSPELVQKFQMKRQRLARGYAPQTERELVDWVKERILIPADEWDQLLQAIERDHQTDIKALQEAVSQKLARITPPHASRPLMIAQEDMPRIAMALGAEGRQEDREETLIDILGTWLQFYGPVSKEFIQASLGIDQDRLSAMIESLTDSQQLITGQLVIDGPPNDLCDSRNFEVLLRMARAEAVPAFEALGIDRLSLFLAHHQGLTHPGEDIDALFKRLEQLLCYPAAAELWEAEFLEARLKSYSPSWLDTLMQEGNLRWIGSEKGKIAFCFESELDLLHGQHRIKSHSSNLADVIPDTGARYDFAALLRASNTRSGELAARLWEAVWEGQITNDTFIALRRGIENRFKAPDTTAAAANRYGHQHRRSNRQPRLSQWKGSLPFAGGWLRLPTPQPASELLEIEERRKDQARLLLDRYGILFRELLAHESRPLRWAEVFRALRLMELSGEVLTGYFFEGIPGPQFISHQAFRALQRRTSEDSIYWMSAADPASICGIDIDAVRGTLPKRIPGNHLVYHGKDVVLISRGNGKALTFDRPPDDPHIQEYLGVLHHLLRRSFQPLKRVTIETINGSPAAHSPYVDALRTGFEVMIEHRKVILYRQRR